MTDLELEEINQRIEKYIKDYNESVTSINAQKAIDEFDDKWEAIISYRIDETPTIQSKYGLALVIFSVAIYESSTTREQEIIQLATLISRYDKNENVKYKFVVKTSLFFNLGSCWHKLGVLYDSKAVEAFKRYIYYSITQSSHTSYRPTAYAFRKCTTFLYQSLINEQLNISSPTTFNDPFDCPIHVLLNKGEDLYFLIRQAYQESLKIACFSSNVKLPYYHEDKGVCSHEKKHKKDKKEYLNSLMWAHYADSHKGICIKYRFCHPISQLGNANPNVVAYFKDVKYSNGNMLKYSNKNSITMEDAFFLKGKQWEYENELRFLFYDLNGTGEYGTIDIPGCIEAIYFGLKCSMQDKQTIQNILQSKIFIQKDLDGTRGPDSPISFYQMELDYKHFGQLKAVKL